MPKTQAMNATNEANGNYAATPQSNEIHSGVGVLDKTVKILDASNPVRQRSDSWFPRPVLRDRPRIVLRSRWNVTVSFCVTSTVVSCSARVSRNLRPQPARTAC